MRTTKFRAKVLDGTWFIWELLSPIDIKDLEPVIDKETIGQFTGLLDKNGKEIYEGDILKTEAEIHSNCEVTFHQGVFGLIGGDSRHYPLRDFTKCGTSESVISIDLEIIGGER